jgi:hypothetical protein
MEQAKAITPWYRRPIWLGLLGLALLVGGYQISVYVPMTPRERTQAAMLADVRDNADEELRQKLDDFARNVRREPPFRWSGRLVMLAGLGLCVTAAVLMARQPAAAPVEESVTNEEAAH